jgi:hypothetical protein
MFDVTVAYGQRQLSILATWGFSLASPNSENAPPVTIVLSIE